MILGVRMYLRAAWDAPDLRHREWYVFKLRDIYGQFVRTSPFWAWGVQPIAPIRPTYPEGRKTEMNPKAKRDIFSKYLQIIRTFVAKHEAKPVHTDIFGRFPIGGAVAEHAVEPVVHPEMHRKVVRYINDWSATWSETPKGPPPQTAFEHTIFHFQRAARRARHCIYVECPAPYFLNVKKSQKYCSKKCAAAGEREAKRRWWHENKDKRNRRSKKQ